MPAQIWSATFMRRILSLDGGGIRGIFTLQVLKQIETLFRDARSRPDLVLRDEFHLFAGTSTGAVIATCLAWGMSVDDVEQLYVQQGAYMFAKAPWYVRWKSKYRSDPIVDMFRQHFCEDDARRSPALLGTSKLMRPGRETYLLIVMRNASTGSPWPVSNNPRAVFNDEALPDCNLRIPLWQLMRASTAAPMYFRPQGIRIAGETHVFVDGGLTAFNNPALIAVLTATLPSYKLEWETGVNKLLVISVGTGQTRRGFTKHDPDAINLVEQAKSLVPALMGSIAQQQDMLCRVIGHCRCGGPIDSELGDLKESGLLPATEKKFSYLRYNREFTHAETQRLRQLTGQRFALDNLRLIPFLQEAGREYSKRTVRADDLMLTVQ